MIIAVSGTPGTGKTAVGRLLAKRLGWRLVELNALAAERKCFCGYDRKRKTKIVDIGKVKKEVQRIARGEKRLILESPYAHDIPNQLTVILRCNPGELRKRLRRKGWPASKIEENVEAEIMEICLSEARELKRKVREIETTGKSPGEVVDRILKALNLTSPHRPSHS